LGRWIVNAAWPYVNTVPHLGTFIHLLSADVYARYLRLRGEDVVAVTGSDEHGTPIEVEALRRGIDPKQLTDHYHNIMLDLLEKYSISFDNYTRTEAPTHIGFTQSFYLNLYDRGYVYKRQVELLHCSRCDKFLPDRFVEGICPRCGFEGARGDQCESCGRVLEPTELKNPRCVFCGSQPELKESTHWFFDLPKLEPDIRKFLTENRQLPENAKNFSLRWLEEGLKPRPLTRDNKWGIPAPFPSSEGKTIYVWMEAVLGYISATIELGERLGDPELWRRYWLDRETKNIHFIGKDNIPFHTIIFPALLIASNEGYTLPWQVSSTEFILYEGQGKFSKSRRIGVWMDEALKIADPEYWRYVLIAIRPEMRDANFTWREFERRINTELNDIIGNFFYRTLTFIKSNFESRVPHLEAPSPADEEVMKTIMDAPSRVGSLMDNFRLRDSLAAIVDLARIGNEYLSRREPWHMIKTDRKDAANVINICSQLASSIAILLYPFMPKTSEEMWGQIGLGGRVEDRRWDEAGTMLVEPNHRIGEPKPLFRKIDLQEIMRVWSTTPGKV